MKTDDTLWFRISLTARLLRKRFDQRARAIGMTRAQWSTIAAVKRMEGAKQRQIADMLEVGEVTAGRLIDRLIEAGWIERRSDPADRRAYRVYLTEGATPVLERLAALGADEQQRAFTGISPEEIAQVTAVLDRVIANLCTPCSHAENLLEEIDEAAE